MDSTGNCKCLTFTTGKAAHEAITVINAGYAKFPHGFHCNFVSALAIENLERTYTFLWFLANEKRTSEMLISGKVPPN